MLNGSDRWASRISETKKLHAAFRMLPGRVQDAFVMLSMEMMANGYDMRQVNRVRAVLIDQARGPAPIEVGE